MKVSEYIADFISKHAARVYSVCGAGAMHLNDALCNHPGLTVIAMQHEQTATFAAEADARVTAGLGVVSVTAGPGGSNTLTGLACAYVDSIPMLVIAGQVTSSTMINNSGLRQLGMNELNMRAIADHVTKSSVTVCDPMDIRWALESAVHEAMTGRKGPVFIEVPLDVQAADINPRELFGFMIPTPDEVDIDFQVLRLLSFFAESDRPVIVVGNGVRLSGACDSFLEFVDRLKIPVIASWGARDIIPSNHPNYIGSCGLFGDRASNYAVQNADLVIAIGTRLSVAQTGHTPALFAPNAKKVMIDIDHAEIKKQQVNLGICADAGQFLNRIDPLSWTRSTHADWMRKCARKKLVERIRDKDTQCVYSDHGVSSYYAVDLLAKHIPDDAIILTDVGFSYIPTMQTMPVRAGQRLFHSSGVSPMGWAIPASVGAAMAGNGRPVICLTGDGGAMMNIQELQTISFNRLPIAIFIYENDGYATMKIAQNNHFKREVIAGPKSGLSLPDFRRVAEAFGIDALDITDNEHLRAQLPIILERAKDRPFITVMHMNPSEVIAPRVQARMQDGQFIPTSIDDMWPHKSHQLIQETEKGLV